MGYLDGAGLAYLWKKITERSIPVKAVTQEEYDALTEEEKNGETLYIMPGNELPQGPQGEKGADATVNGVSTLTIQAGENIFLKQEGSILTISAAGGSSVGAEEIYSTEERVIGRWIDNRPLYRKTFEKEGFNIFGKNIWTLIDMQGCKIHRWHGYIDDGYSQFPLNFNISDINLESQFGTENYIMTCIEESGQALVLQSGLNTSMSNVSVVFTVEYTRNADQPVGTAGEG